MMKNVVITTFQTGGGGAVPLTSDLRWQKS